MQLTLKQVAIDSLSGQSLLNIDHAQFQPGVCALTGGNGAGKSTLLKVLANLHRFKSGSIHLNGYSLAENPKGYLQNTCYMPQNFAAYAELSGFEFLRYLLTLQGADRKSSKTLADLWLDKVGLQNARHKATGTYSQGMLQKLGFAYAIAVNKSLTIMDEPFAGVDPEARESLMNMLFAQELQHRIFIVCTHHVEEMRARGVAIKKITDGKLIACGTE